MEYGRQAADLVSYLGELGADGLGYNLVHPHTGRRVYFACANLDGISRYLPANLSALKSYDRTAERRQIIQALLAARLNFRTLVGCSQTGDTLTLARLPQDPHGGYYYPENGRTSWFAAHGRIYVDRYLLAARPHPPNGLQAALDAACKIHANTPFTTLGTASHGIFTYLVLARRLNGRPLLFGKLAWNGRRQVRMTHWARVVGWEATTLIRICGLAGSV
jgi:hypothetical protein